MEQKGKEVKNCTSLWAELTNIGLGVATSLKKQVKVIDLLIKLILLQANSILKSDDITISKASKGEDFTEHKNILEKALAGNPCPGRKGMNTAEYWIGATSALSQNS